MYQLPAFCSAFQTGYQTHPAALDRYNNILNNALKTEKFCYKPYEQILEWSEVLKAFILEDISENYGDLYDDEAYGSIYLDKPNTEWRGKELVDRVDY